MRVRAGLLASALLVAAAGCSTKKAKDEPAPEPAPEAPKPKAEPDQQWNQVVAWAKPLVKPGDAALFNRAVKLAKPHAKAIRTAEKSAQRYAVDAKSLPPEVDEAVEALVAWSEAGDGLALGVCGEPGMTVTRDVFTAFELARAALLTAPDDPEHPRVRAVLYLGHRLRGEGKSGIEVSVGVALATTAIGWAEAREVKPGKAFRELAPVDGLVFRTLAAEAVCQVRIVEAAVDDPNVVGQLAEVRAYNIETVYAAFERRDDPDKLAAYLMTRWKQGRGKPATSLLNTLSSSTRSIADIATESASYKRSLILDSVSGYD